MCAKVRIRIQQRLALTRDAFKATLELENGETAKLTAIRVVLHIDNHQTKASALQHFAIGEHTALENRLIILIHARSVLHLFVFAAAVGYSSEQYLLLHCLPFLDQFQQWPFDIIIFQ